MDYKDKGAVISDCGRYRYRLWRTWDVECPRLMFVMLNPSTADAAVDDQTIRKIVAFAKAWGFGGIEVCNLFAYRTKSPTELIKASRLLDVVGPDNDSHIRAALTGVSEVVCAWGGNALKVKYGESHIERMGWRTFTTWRQRQNGAVLLLLDNDMDPQALKINADGTPAHPLYLPMQSQRKSLSPF